MELFFLALLIALMATALASGFPVAFALPGSAIITIVLAALSGYLFQDDITAYYAQGGPIEWLNAGVTNFRGIYWEPERDTLIAIPLFIFMGIMLERSKIAEDLLVTMAQLFGPIPGGLGISVIVVGALLAATTGIVGATVVAMGLISLPVMLRNTYSRPLATGTISAAGTLGQIIPPSIVLIILADQLSNATDQALTLRKAEYKFATGSASLPSEFGVTSTSAGEMFLGAFLPGLVLVGLYILFILASALLRPKTAPPVRLEGKMDRRFAVKVLVVLVPPLALILAVLGSILAGIATVNQAGAIGAAGALLMAGYRLKIGEKSAYYPVIIAGLSLVAIYILLRLFDINVKNIKDSTDVIAIALATVAVFGLLVSLVWSGWRAYKTENTLNYVMVETAKTTALVFIILLGAAMLTAAFRAFGGEEVVKDFLAGLPGGFMAKFALVMVVIFILGFFLDFIEIAVVVVPIISPILLADTEANITAVWLGVMIGINIQTSFLTPPFGFALFYLRGVAPPIVKTVEMYRGVIPFILLQLFALGIVAFYPSLVNYLPNRVFLTSETAPPPTNPRLQACIEEVLFDRYDAQENVLRAAIDKADRLNVSYLPEEKRTAFKSSLEKARATFDLVERIRRAEAAVDAYIPEYGPLHREVRRIQSRVRNIDEEIQDLRRAIRQVQLRRGGTRTIEEMRGTIAELESEKERIITQIPERWETAHQRFVELSNAEQNARQTYRRNVDEAYGPVRELLTLIDQAGQMAELQSRIEALPGEVAGEAPAQATERIAEILRDVRRLDGTGDIASALSTARRALRGDAPDRAEAQRQLQQAIELFRAETAWRTRAAEDLAPGLREYEQAIRHTIGLRMQQRLPTNFAADVAGCQAKHRDISLYF